VPFCSRIRPAFVGLSWPDRGEKWQPRDTARVVSAENVEIAKQANAALNRGDIEGLLQCYAGDAELRDLQSAPDQPLSVSGIDAIRRVLIDWTAAFDAFRADVEEYIDVGDTVVTAVRWRGQGKESGLAIDNAQYDVFKFQDGKVTRAVLGYRSRDEALEAANAEADASDDDI
jgi:ketosteroid isomerase-like protein